MTTFWIKEFSGAYSTSVRSMMQHVILRSFSYAEIGVELWKEALDWTHSVHDNLEHFLKAQLHWASLLSIRRRFK